MTLATIIVPDSGRWAKKRASVAEDVLFWPAPFSVKALDDASATNPARPVLPIRRR